MKTETNSTDFWASPTSCLSFQLTSPSATPPGKGRPGLATEISKDGVFYPVEGMPLRPEKPGTVLGITPTGNLEIFPPDTFENKLVADQGFNWNLFL